MVRLNNSWTILAAGRKRVEVPVSGQVVGF